MCLNLVTAAVHRNIVSEYSGTSESARKRKHLRSPKATPLVANQGHDSGPSHIPGVLNLGQGPVPSSTPQLMMASPTLAPDKPAEQPWCLGARTPAEVSPHSDTKTPPTPDAPSGQMQPSCPGMDRHHTEREMGFEGCFPKLLKA